MANLFTQQEIEKFARSQGHDITATGGAFERLRQSDPSLNQSYLQFVDRRLAGKEANAASAAAPQTGGVMPIGIEPLHQFERQGLERLGAGVTAQRDPMSEQYLQNFGKYADQAAGMFTQSAAPVTGEEITSMMSPYDQAVTDRSIDNLSSQAQKMREQLLRRTASDRPNANFGDLYGAQRMADIDEELLDKSGDMRVAGQQQSWQDAMKRAFANRELQQRGGAGVSNVGQGFTSAGQVAQNTAGQGMDDIMQGIMSQIGAGSDIRGFNQGVSDMAMGNYMQPDAFENMLTETATSYNPNAVSFNAAPVNRTADILRGAGAAMGDISKIRF